VLDEPSFRGNAAKMGAALARCGGPACAAALIDDLAGRASQANAL
jgi:UDP:flavonoid glycosyltransferase YjiC (YdhE family)